MKISFIVNYIYINDGWSPWDIRIGGSEEAVVEWARCLSKDHQVQVFHNGQHGDFNGVAYRDHSEYEPGDITINVNYPQFAPQGKTVYYTSLTDNPPLEQFDAVACLSQYAKDHTNLPDRTLVVPLGYNPARVYPDKKVAKQCFYASSPDRGLDILLEAWPKVYENHPDATLVLTYGGHSELPGVINLGEADEITMDEIYNSSDIWCHPCTGGELFCITGKKAQAAGCIPVIIPTMALAETVERGFKTNKDNYAQSLVEVLGLSMEYRDDIRLDIIKHANALSWEESTGRLLEIINTVL